MKDEKSDALLAAPPAGGRAVPVRDPRVDPKPGDVLRKGASERRVEAVMLPYAAIEPDVHWVRSDGRMFRLWLPYWLRWAASAEVIRIAPMRRRRGLASRGASREEE